MSAELPTRQVVARLEVLRQRVAAAAGRSGRSPDAVKIVAVTKRRPLSDVEPLLDAGLRDLGENYPQELWKKADELAGRPVQWHLIGHLQSNKLARTFPIVTMIHAVDSLKLLNALNERAANSAHSPSVCLQVNCSGERSKHGWSPETILVEATQIATCAAISIVGLMTMAALGPDPESSRPAFRMLRETREKLRAATGLPLPELSMGMSNDYAVAVEEGATWIRIGTALFEGNP